jgi:hypothetical protein
MQRVGGSSPPRRTNQSPGGWLSAGWPWQSSRFRCGRIDGAPPCAASIRLEWWHLQGCAWKRPPNDSKRLFSSAFDWCMDGRPSSWSQPYPHLSLLQNPGIPMTKRPGSSVHGFQTPILVRRTVPCSAALPSRCGNVLRFQCPNISLSVRFLVMATVGSTNPSTSESR